MPETTTNWAVLAFAIGSFFTAGALLGWVLLIAIYDDKGFSVNRDEE
jgi:hypothetical protein